MEGEILKSAMAAIGTAFGKEAASLSLDQIKAWFQTASQSMDSTIQANPDEIDKLAQEVLKDDTPLLDAEVTRRNLARWFEIPQEEFTSTPTVQLEPEVLIRHIYLEDLFGKWLEDWNYKTLIGEDLEGRESIDFTPDVYGVLETLHGEFEICINFVCDQPPSQYRVRALLETLEAYATESSEFKYGDIYILASPFEFGRGTSASIRLQSREEKYTVLKLEGNDLYELRNARDEHSRFLQLMEHVEKAKKEGPTR